MEDVGDCWGAQAPIVLGGRDWGCKRCGWVRTALSVKAAVEIVHLVNQVEVIHEVGGLWFEICLRPFQTDAELFAENRCWSLLTQS